MEDNNENCRMGFLLDSTSSAQLLELVRASCTPPEEIVAQAIFTMWQHSRSKIYA